MYNIGEIANKGVDITIFLVQNGLDDSNAEQSGAALDASSAGGGEADSQAAEYEACEAVVGAIDKRW